MFLIANSISGFSGAPESNEKKGVDPIEEEKEGDLFSGESTQQPPLVHAVTSRRTLHKRWNKNSRSDLEKTGSSFDEESFLEELNSH